MAAVRIDRTRPTTVNGDMQHRHWTSSALILAVSVACAAFSVTTSNAGEQWQFKMQELERSLGVGYAVRLVDVDGDGKRDIVVVDRRRVVWYQNPNWRRRVIIEGRTRPDNVCIAPYDIDGDGKLDFALGADWTLNTRSGGTIQWLRRGKSLDDQWEIYPIGEEPTVHRIRFADTDGDGRKELIIVPLLGRNSTRAKNFMDGQPVRTIAFHIPKDPTRDRWIPEILDQSLHVVHNFWPIPDPRRKGCRVLMASYEGVSVIERDASGRWRTRRIGKGNQSNPMGRRGASEIKLGKTAAGKEFIATIEPWHGYQVVVYTPPGKAGAMWKRHVIDDRLRWGHAVWCADLDGDGGDELIIGVRDDPAKGDDNVDRRGVRIYRAMNASGSRWSRQIIDNGGIACEDLAAADMDGDGRIDIVAVGRQTHNLRIYWNRTKQAERDR